LREQQAIGAVLSDVDALLGSLDRLISKKRDLKQAAMQQLLTGRTRLLGFSRAWEWKRVDEMGEVLAGKALDIDGPGRLRPYLRTKNVLDGRIDLEDVLEMPMTDTEFERFRVRRGDVLLNEGQSLDLVGRCSLYRDELAVPCAMQNQLLRFRARAQTSSAFAEHLFRRCQHTGIFSAIATQTTSVAHLGSSRFSGLQLQWPLDLAEQEAIATVLSDMDAELTALEQRREKTRLLKQGMMQELLTGRTRLV
jgi:type I restriction enzyme S subunit